MGQRSGQRLGSGTASVYPHQRWCGAEAEAQRGEPRSPGPRAVPRYPKDTRDAEVVGGGSGLGVPGSQISWLPLEHSDSPCLV